MDFDTAWSLFEQLRGKQATVLCTDEDVVTGKLIDLMEEQDNEYDAIFLNTDWPGCVEIPLAEIVSIAEAETAS